MFLVTDAQLVCQINYPKQIINLFIQMEVDWPQSTIINPERVIGL